MNLKDLTISTIVWKQGAYRFEISRTSKGYYWYAFKMVPNSPRRDGMTMAELSRGCDIATYDEAEEQLRNWLEKSEEVEDE